MALVITLRREVEECCNEDDGTQLAGEEVALVAF